MSHVDERIREDLAGLTRPVPVDGVLEQVAVRKTRRRRVRRIESFALAAVVLVGSLMATVALTRVLEHGSSRTPADGATTGSSPSARMEESALCDESQVNTDVDGDGVLDEVAVGSPSRSDHCRPLPPDVGRRYVLHISGGKLAELASPGATEFPGVRFYGIDQNLPECTQPFACRLFAAPDLDGAGADELAVETSEDGATRTLVFYRAVVDPAADRYALVRMDIEAPGDPQFGFPSGPATFQWGRSANRWSSIRCVSHPDGRHTIVASSAVTNQSGDPVRYDVHLTEFHLKGTSLVVDDTKDFHDVTVQEDGPGPWSDPTDQLCGAPVLAG